MSDPHASPHAAGIPVLQGGEDVNWTPTIDTNKLKWAPANADGCTKAKTGIA